MIAQHALRGLVAVAGGVVAATMGACGTSGTGTSAEASGAPATTSGQSTVGSTGQGAPSGAGGSPGTTGGPGNSSGALSGSSGSAVAVSSVASGASSGSASGTAETSSSGGSAGSPDASAGASGNGGREAGASSEAGVSGEDGFGLIDAGAAVDGGPAFSGPITAGTVTVSRTATAGRLSPGFVGFSFEKTHVTDSFFTADNAALIALFKLIGPGIVRIGADDADNAVWAPAALPAGNGQTSLMVGTADVDALAAFLTATGWRTIYGVNMTKTMQASVDEAVYVSSKLGESLHTIEIGNEINNFAGSPTTPEMTWAAYQAAIAAAAPGVLIAGPAAASSVTSFTVPFADTYGSKIALLTQHYYKAAASTHPTMSDLLAIDPAVAADSKALSAAVAANRIVDGYRWGEMNSYSGHGAVGLSDAFGSALWSIDFMLTTAQYGAGGVNFHGGGQNMDNNVCTNGVASCTKPFHYSPIDEVDSKVTAAAPLFYGMLLVARTGVGDMLPTTATAGSLNFSGYAVSLADGSTNVVLVNKDASNGISARVDLGAPVASADATYLLAPSLTATTGITLAGSGVSVAGGWTPQPPYALPKSGNVATVLVPPASAVIVHAQ